MTSLAPPAADLRALWREHGSTQRIAAVVGVDRRTVQRWIEPLGVRVVPPQRRLTPEKRRRATVLAREGMPFTFISEDLGVSRETLQDHLKDCRPADGVAEWKAVWFWLLKEPEMMALHREMYPNQQSPSWGT